MNILFDTDSWVVFIFDFPPFECFLVFKIILCTMDHKTTKLSLLLKDSLFQDCITLVPRASFLFQQRQILAGCDSYKKEVIKERIEFINPQYNCCFQFVYLTLN